MSLPDLFGAVDLSLYPQAGLVIFFAVFAAIAARVARRPADALARCARMPIDDAPARRTTPADPRSRP